MRKFNNTIVAVLSIVFLSACAGKAHKTDPELSEMEGKRVALVELQGEATAKKVIEVALVNQLLKTGAFFLVNKKDVDAARENPEQDPLDLDGIAKRAGADYSLKAKVVEFDASEKEGYSAIEEEDSLLKTERGDEGAQTKRYYKVKSMKGTVRVQIEFTRLPEEGEDEDNKDKRIGIAEYSDEVIKEAKTESIHLPPKLRFLESVANEAFRRFFEKYK